MQPMGKPSSFIIWIMKSSKILYTSADVRKTIIDIFEKSKGRRVAITAFVGDGAEAYLRKPKGIELICWPQAGGTNPDAIRRLIKLGVKVSFAKSLHMKVYWTKDKGAVVTSANLSKNALGSGNLMEFGVLVPSGQIDIDRLLKQIKPRSEIKSDLLKLDKAHRQHHVDNKLRPERKTLRTYLEWYVDAYREEWKTGFFSSYGNFSQNARELAKVEYSVSSPSTCISMAKGSYNKHEWLLTFTIRRGKPIDVMWLFVDYIVATSKKDKVYDRQNPYQAVQVWPDNRYPAAPFKIDARFRSALAKTVKAYKNDNYPIKPTKRFLDLLYKNYQPNK